MRTFRTIVIACLAFASFGCTAKKQGELWINNVVRVLMHEPHRYTLFSQEPGHKELSTHEFNISRGRGYINWHGEVLARCNIHLRIDVPAGESMWATSERWGDSPPGDDCILTIHLHDPTEVDGGGWNHGKHGRGTTQVVE